MARVEPNISREALFEKLEYKPHSEYQWEAHRAEERFRIMCCGRRWGKSQWAGHEMTYKMFVPDSINWIVGPEYKLGEKEFRVVWDDFKKLGLLGRCKKQYNKVQGNMSIYFPDLNSLCEVKSAQKPDSLVGEGVDHICVSEAAKHARSTWEMYLRSSLADRKGSADFPSTPQGFNWYGGLYDLGQDKDHPDYYSQKHPSWENPILFPKGRHDPEILLIEAGVSEMWFDQEIGAEFTAFEGQIYPEFKEKIHVKEFDYNPHWKNWWALDFGYTDPFICLDIMIDPVGRVWVWREYVSRFQSTTEHGLHLKNQDNPEGFHVDGIAADPRGADEIATLQWIIGGIMHDAVGWGSGIEEIKRAMKVRPDGEPGFFVHPRCKELIRQLKRLRKKEIKEGHNEKPGQHDYDDHTCDALRYFFNEYFVLGANATLRDVYDNSYAGSDAESFFKLEGSITTNVLNW